MTFGVGSPEPAPAQMSRPRAITMSMLSFPPERALLSVRPRTTSISTPYRRKGAADFVGSSLQEVRRDVGETHIRTARRVWIDGSGKRSRIDDSGGQPIVIP
jgi:hypothetical protein